MTSSFSGSAAGLEEAITPLNYRLNVANVSGGTTKYQVSYFDFANRELIRQARDKNLDGATLAYNQLTVSCVQCHKIVRDRKKQPE